MKRPPTRVERQRAYLRYREVFSGNNALVRTKKDIIDAIQASSTSEPSAIQHRHRRTISILRSLLESQVFQLEEQAKKEFPELWLKIPKGNETLPHSNSTQLIKLEDFETNLTQAKPQSTLRLRMLVLECCD